MPHAVLRVAVDGGERRHARIGCSTATTGGVSLTVAIVNASAPRRLTGLDELGLDLAQQESIGAARVAGAGQALILHDVDDRADATCPRPASA